MLGDAESARAFAEDGLSAARESGELPSMALAIVVIGIPPWGKTRSAGLRRFATSV